MVAIFSTLGIYVSCFSTLLSVVYGVCPGGCSCTNVTGFRVYCNALRALPTGIPTETNELHLVRMMLTNIPPMTFHDLPCLKSVKIFNSDIGNIGACAFTSLNHLDKIAIYNSHIGSVDKFAFNDLRNISKLELYDSTIGVVDSYAFHNLRDISSFTLRNLSIANINPRAFYEIHEVTMFTLSTSKIKTIHSEAFDRQTVTMAFVRVIGNTIEDLQCGTIDILKREVSMNQFTFESNRLVCDCRVLWMLHTDAILRDGDILSGAVCRGMNDTPLAQLTSANITCSTNTGSKQVTKCAVPEIESPEPQCVFSRTANLKASSAKSSYSLTMMLTFLWLNVSEG